MNTLPPEVMDEITDAIYRGRKLEAVKIYKEARGTKLMEAKTFIEDLTEELKAESPERFEKQSVTGCLGTLVLLAVSIAVLIASLIAKA